MGSTDEAHDLLSKYYWMAARGVKMSKELPGHCLAKGGLKEMKTGSRKMELGVAVKREPLGLGGRSQIVKFPTFGKP